MYRWHGFAVDAYDMQLMPVTCIDAYDMLHLMPIAMRAQYMLQLMPIAMRAQHVACTISQAPPVYPSHTCVHPTHKH